MSSKLRRRGDVRSPCGTSSDPPGHGLSVFGASIGGREGEDSVSARPGSGLRPRLAALVRLLAAISLLAVGGVHFQQYIVADFRVIPTIGRLFLLNFIGGTVLGVHFLIPASRHPGRLGLLVDAMAALAGWFLAAGALVGLLRQRAHRAVRVHGARISLRDRVRDRLRSCRDRRTQHPARR